MNTSRESAKWRTRLRSVEADCDALTATLTALQKQRVEQAAAAHGVTADALWAAGAELDTLLTDGEPDAEAIAAAAQTTRDTLGIEQPPKPSGLRGLSSGSMPQPPPTDRWSNAFKPK